MQVFTPFRLCIFFIALSAFSLVVCLPRLPLQYLPQPSGSLLTASYNLPGATPQVAEQQATSLLENSLSAIGDIEMLYSKSRYNGGQVSLRFKKGADMQQKQFEAASILRLIYPQLPAQTSYPTLQVQAPNANTRTQPLLIYSIYAPMQDAAIAQAIEANLLPTLRQWPGVKQVSTSGTPQQQLTIQYDATLCRAWGIETETIAPAIEQVFSGWYGGAITRHNGGQYFVHISGTDASPQDVSKVAIYNNQGKAIALGKFCTIRLEEQKPQQWFRINGQNALSLMVYAQPGENEVQLSTQLKQAMEGLKSTLPAGFSLLLNYDDAEFLRTEIAKNNRRAAMCIGILLLFILAAYRNFKHILVLGVSLAVTLSITVLFAYLLQIPIHLYSIAGIAIAFGLLIDNAIVMVDYYRQYGNRHAFLALLAATLTTIAALTLVFLLPENDRLNLDDFATIITIALAASLLVSLGFTPAFYDVVWGTFKKSKINSPSLLNPSPSGLQKWYGKSVAFLAHYRKLTITFCMLAFGLPLFMLPDTMPEGKTGSNLYNATIGSAWYRQHLRPVVDKYLGGALYQFRYYVFEKSGYRSPEKTRLHVRAELPFGHTPEQMNQLMLEMDAFLGTFKGIEKFVTNVYSGQEAGVEIHFTRQSENEGLPYVLKSRLISRAVDWGGADWDVYGVGRGFSNAGGIEVPNFRLKLTGYNYDETELLAKRLAVKLLEHPRIQKVNTNERADWGETSVQEYVLTLNEKELATMGASNAIVFKAVQQQSFPEINQLYLPLQGRLTPVSLMADGAEDFSVHRLINQSMPLDSTRQLSLKRAAKLELTTTSNSIVRENRSYVRIVSFDYLGSGHFGNKYLDKVLNEINPGLKPGYTINKEYYNWDWGKTKRQYGLLFLLALAIFCICAILFGRFKQAIYIVVMIPISFIGLMLAFAWGDFYFDQGGYAAFVLLSGLVVNAAIYVVNDWNHLQKLHPMISPNILLLQASYGRARTILLTALSTTAGLLPFLWEGQQEIFWFSFSVGAIGGLLLSLPAVWWVLPILLWKNKASKNMTSKPLLTSMNSG
jgi:multidrug efflux pump subunit AcrB